MLFDIIDVGQTGFRNDPMSAGEIVRRARLSVISDDVYRDAVLQVRLNGDDHLIKPAR